MLPAGRNSEYNSDPALRWFLKDVERGQQSKSYATVSPSMNAPFHDEYPTESHG